MSLIANSLEVKGVNPETNIMDVEDLNDGQGTIKEAMKFNNFTSFYQQEYDGKKLF